MKAQFVKSTILFSMVLLFSIKGTGQNLSSVPSGSETVALTADCTGQQLEREALAAGTDVKKFESVINSFFSKCEKQLTNGRLTGSFLGLINFGIVEYWFNHSSVMKKIVVENNQGEKTPGYLAMKPGPLARPMVLLKCGVFCSGDTVSSTMNYMINLFDQSPFHVLLLSNRTGVSYIRENKFVTMGGALEGKDLIEIADWMKNSSPYKDQISSLHLVGYSLGGHAASYAALYNDQAKRQGREVFSSIIPICSALNLEPTMRKLYQPGLAGTAALGETKAVFSAVQGYVPGAEDLIADENLPKDITEYPDRIVEILMRYQMPRRGLASTPESQFWQNNNFFNQAKALETPTFFWASKNDPVVNYPLNSGRMIASEPLHHKAKNVAAVGLNYGSHCGFNAAYGIPSVSAALRSFILNHSPEMTNRRVSHKVSLNWKALPLRPGVVISDYMFVRTNAGLSAEFTIFDSDRDPSCLNKKYTQAHHVCFTKIRRALGTSLIKEFQLFEPKNDVDLQTQTRMLNSWIELKHKGKDLRGLKATPDSLEWSDYR